MSLLISHTVYSTPIMCKGTTLEEAKEEARKLAQEYREKGHFAVIDNIGCQIAESTYAWNVLLKRAVYK